jgi:hypothetical protein
MISTPVIPKGRPELPLLDFDVLRTEGIRHLEQLATEFWTDFNAHDPGITILEVLCYVLTDLGYRTHLLPIQDLVTPGKSRDHFFLADEILVTRPVTPDDYRRLMIDVPGVRNAWIEKQPKTWVKNPKGSANVIVSDQRINFSKSFDEAIEKVGENWALKEDSAWYPIMLKLYPKQKEREMWTNKLGDYVHRGNEPEDWQKLSPRLRSQIMCYFGGTFNLDIKDYEKVPLDEVHLNGIYKITLDLDATVNPNNLRDVDAVVEKVLARLHANRGLCQDFEQPVVMEVIDVCLHLDLNIDPDFDEYKVMAEVIWNLQAYFTPGPHFYTFQEMVAKGAATPEPGDYAVEQIFNGPLLDHGFLDDRELREARRRTQINRSDMVRIIRETPGVTGIQKLQVKTPFTLSDSKGEESKFTIADIKGKPAKWVIDPCCSCFIARGRNFPVQIPHADLEPQLEHLNLVRNCRICGERGGPDVPGGVYRADLGDYRSVQYEFPNNYVLGDNPVPEADGPTRRAQARQMQAYLLFYDRIFAGYLRQLGNLRELFSVRQDLSQPAMVAVALYEVPGVRELLQDFGTFILNGPKLPALEPIRDKSTLLWQRLNELVDEYNAAPADNKPRYQKTAFVARMTAGGLEATFDLYKELILDVAYSAGPDDATWENITDPVAGKTNPYALAIQRIVENKAQEHDRHNRLLNHLLARFGETFADFSLALLRSDEFPEDNTWQQPFDQYLRAKADFLRLVPVIGSERGLGYNYRLFDAKGKNPDVWNSFNVSGLKKRVYTALGIKDFKEQDLFTEPGYTLRIDRTQVKQGRPHWIVYLIERATSDRLLKSDSFSQQAQAVEYSNLLYRNLHLSGSFEELDGTKKRHKRIVFQLPKSDPDNIKYLDKKLSSADIPDGESDRFQRRIERLVALSGNDREGFHLVEHLLLRPDDIKDDLLILPVLDCEGLLKDPYSFWLTVVLPDWPGRFGNSLFRRFVEQVIRTEAPAHIALRLLWLDKEDMIKFEKLFKDWLEEKARCRPNACTVTESANALIQFLIEHPGPCPCTAETEAEQLCNPLFFPNNTTTTTSTYSVNHA